MKPGLGRVATVAVTAAGYALIAVPALRQLGAGAGSLGMIPVTAAAIAFGLRGGLLVFALVVAIDVPLYRLAGLDFLAWRTILYTILFGLLTAVLGQVRDVARSRLRERQDDLERQERLRLAQREIYDARDRFAALVEQIPAVTYVYSLREDRLTYISPQVHELFGFSVEDWLGRPQLWHEQIHSDDRQRAFIRLERSRHTGEPYNCECRMLTSRGQAIWVQHRALVRRDEDGTAIEIQGVMFDVSDRKRMEEALQASESRYRTLVEASPDAILVTDQEGRTVMCNRELVRMIGAASEQAMIGRQAAEVVAPEDRVRLAGWIGQVRSTGPVSGLEFCLLASGSRRIPAELAIAAIHEGEGEPAATVCLIRDLSERRQAEAALRESEAKSRFLATMSHELRTPLNSVLGFAQLLASTEFGPLTDRQGRYVENIRASGRHLLDLVNDVLDVAEVRGGLMHLRLEPVQLRESLTLALSRVRHQAEAKRIRLELERSPELSARADRERLAQVMSNLLSNAIKFTPPGGSVTVSLAQNDGQVGITVRDTGIGIPAEDQARIFDHFVQIENGRTRKQQGTGLGLALTRELVNLMAGSISLDSRTGAGSAFTVSLPLVAYDPPAEPLQTGPRSRAVSRRISG